MYDGGHHYNRRILSSKEAQDISEVDDKPSHLHRASTGERLVGHCTSEAPYKTLIDTSFQKTKTAKQALNKFTWEMYYIWNLTLHIPLLTFTGVSDVTPGTAVEIVPETHEAWVKIKFATGLRCCYPDQNHSECFLYAQRQTGSKFREWICCMPVTNRDQEIWLYPCKQNEKQRHLTCKLDKPFFLVSSMPYISKCSLKMLMQVKPNGMGHEARSAYSLVPKKMLGKRQPQTFWTQVYLNFVHSAANIAALQ